METCVQTICLSSKLSLIMIFIYLSNGQNNGFYNFINNKKVVFFFVLKMQKKIPDLLFDDCALEYVSQHRHLGALFSSNLN